MKKRNHYIFCIMVSAVFWLFFSFTGETYISSDNTQVAIIINGLFGSPLSQYQHPLLCLSINALSILLPSSDVYTLTVHIFIFLELVVLLLIISERPFQKPIRKCELNDYLLIMFSVLTAAFLSAGLKLWQANYTMQAASFLLTGWVVLFYAKRSKKGWRWITAGTIFIALGYMLRKEAGLLFIPFIVLMIWHEVLMSEDKKAQWRALMHYMFPAIATLFALFTSQTIFTAIEPYAGADRYNGARTAMVDFPIKTWDESFEGINNADYIAVRNWMLADTEAITVESLETMEAVGARDQYSLTFSGLQSALADMWRIVAKTDIYVSMMIMPVLILTGFIVVTGKKWTKLAAISGLLGAFLILLYFTFRGRALMHVWVLTLFALICLEIVLLLSNKLDRKKFTAILLLVSIVLYFSAGQVIAHAKFHDFQTVLTSRVDADESAYEQTKSDDDLYLWPLWHGTILADSWVSGELPSAELLKHNVALGYWTAGQPYYTAFLEQIGHPNPIRDLVEKDNVYVMSNADYILNFLREHYGNDIDLVEAGEVNGMTAYRVVRERA